MNQDHKRALENQLLVMGLPKLDDPNLIQVLADMVNAFPIMRERVDFFCDLLNECDAGRRYEMYTAMTPRLSFEVPSFGECEIRIAQKAERMVGRTRTAKVKNDAELTDKILRLECFGCKEKGAFVGLTLTDAMSQAHKAGWGRGPVAGEEFCGNCRMQALTNTRLGQLYTRRAHA